MDDPMFFWSWPTWAKLGFVLGGCLIIVLILAGLIKIRGMFKIKRFAEARKTDIERAEMTQRIRSSDEMPFGDKAMIEDPDVEGVWNSRASTPLQSPVLAPRSASPSRLSINLFSRSRRNSSVSSFTNLNLPEAATTSSATGEPPTPSPAGISTASTAAAAPPRRRSVTTRAVLNQDLMSSAPRHGEKSTSSSNSDRNRRSRVSTDPGPATPVHERRSRTIILGSPPADYSTLERTPTTKKALDRMEAHRKFHAAESGQLQPRPRLVEERVARHKHSASDNLSLEYDVPRAVSWPITPGEAFVVDFSAPQKVQTMTSPHVVPFRAFVEMHPPPKAPPSAWTEKTQGMLDEKLEARASKRRITIRNENAGKNAKELYTVTNKDDIKSKEESASLLGTQLRRVNKGFEILPAGTLRDQSFAKNFGYLEKPLREASNDTVKPKKLQKRNRSNSSSRRSSIETLRQIAV